MERQNSEGRSVSEAPFNFDGDKPNSVRLNSQPRRSFIFQPQFCWGVEWALSSTTKLELDPALLFRRSGTANTAPRCDDTRRSTDRLSSSCFVLHRMGVFLPHKLPCAR